VHNECTSGPCARNYEIVVETDDDTYSREQGARMCVCDENVRVCE
jgi:hypothetical protein